MIKFRALILIASAVALWIAAQASYAQTAPTAAEVSSYSGLHRAAHENNIDEIRRLVAAGENTEVRDRHGRTPVHVAAFCLQ